MKTWLLVFPKFLLLSLSFVAKGQTEDSSLLKAALNSAIGVHDKQLKDQLPILNGSVFVGYPHHFSSGTAFFPPGHFEAGEIVYDGVKYENVPLVYDILAGQVIAELTLNIRLVPEKTVSFRILNHRFERIASELLPTASGFYECLDSGYAILYKKTAKSLVAKSSPAGKETEFSIAENNSYLLLKDGRIHPADNEKQVLTALDDGKDQLPEFIRTGLPTALPGNYELRLIKIIAFYNDTKRHESR